MQQMSIFDDVIPRFMIDRKLRLITLFSGIGCQERGLKAFNIPFESYKTCEWAANSIIGFNAIHNHIYKNKNVLDKEFVANELYKLGVSVDYNKPATLDQLKRIEINKLNYIYESIKETHNLVNICNVKGKDLEIVEKDKYCYCLTYSFPCQDLSNAGLKKGITEDSRSGMLFQVERILDECKELGCLPDILIMENVPDLVNKKFIKDFQRWRAKLEQIGYSNFDEILNGKHFGIAQNRKREFMVSILGEYNYTMPKPIKLKHHLGDFLMDDSKVDKKYYLSEKMLNGMKHTKFNSYKLEHRLQEREREIDTLTTATGSRCPHLLEVQQDKKTRI